MSTVIKTALLALALAAGSASVQASDVLRDGASTGHFVTTGGILSGR